MSCSQEDEGNRTIHRQTTSTCSLHLLFTYVALVATTSPDVSVRVEITAVCKVRNASHTGCLKNHANIVNKIHRTVTRTFNYFALLFLIMHHCSLHFARSLSANCPVTFILLTARRSFFQPRLNPCCSFTSYLEQTCLILVTTLETIRFLLLS